MRTVAYSTLLTHIYRTSTTHTAFDITSIAFIGSFAKDAPIFLSLVSGTSMSDFYLRQASWSAFLLDNIMYPLIAFCARPSSGTSVNINIDFTVTSLNVGNAWNSATDKFTAPQSGIYVFRVNIGAVSGYSSHATVQVNNVAQQSVGIWSNNHNGNDQTGKTFALSLTAGNTVSIDAGGSIYSDDFFITSFAGFLYEPLEWSQVHLVGPSVK